MPGAHPQEPSTQDPKPPTNRSTRSLGAGLTLVVCVLLFAFGGRWLDGQLETRPLFMLIGIALGFIGGMIHFVSSVAPNALPWKKRKRSSTSNSNDSSDPLGKAPSGKEWKRWDDSDFDDERAAKEAARKNNES